jgi:uncharacterized protein (DUF2236 family)
MLEMAHPLIAAGVTQHSNFRQSPLGRLQSTVRTMVLLTFGDARMAQVAARHTHRCHAPVHGVTAAGAPYDAGDPALRLWVFATLIDSVLVVHDEFVRPLAPGEKAAYYEDSKRMARMLGVTTAIMPPDYGAFQEYVRRMLNGDTLSVGEDGREIMRALFNHPFFGLIARAGSFAGIGLLPERLRAEFGIRWSERDERRLRALAAWSRRLRRHLPDFLCTFPAASYYAWRYRHDARA